MQDRAIQSPKVGRYELVERIGRGGQGTVFLARDPQLDRRVALKLLDVRHAQSAAPRADLLEGRVSSRLRHPAIVAIFDAGEIRGIPYLVFEYVEGRTLRTMLEAGRALEREHVYRLIEPVLEGMAHAHAQGIVHLDLGPGNILVDREGMPRIMDFGLARFVDAPAKSSAVIAGTLRYLAPEHCLQQPLGPHTDVYALCLIVYALLTGRPARKAISAKRVLEQVTSGEIDFGPLAADRSLAPIARLLQTGLARETAARYPDGGALLEAYRTLVRPEGTASAPGPHSTVGFLLRRMERRKDFPALSQSIMEVNRLTASGSHATVDKLANVILRDYSLTQRLLAMANSAFFAGGIGEVTSVSQAVRLLGFEQVRLAANGIAFISHLGGEAASDALCDALVRAFFAGLVARHLAKRCQLARVEEAFICGMFQNLGETLAMRFLAEEHAEANALARDQGLDRESAARGVLGISYSELGVCVARHWKFPEVIQRTIAELPAGELLPEPDEEVRLHRACAFAAELSRIPDPSDPARAEQAVETLMQRFGAALAMDEDGAYELLDAAVTRLEALAPSLGMTLGEGAFHAGARALLERYSTLCAEVDLDRTVENPRLIAALRR